jgi:hypothetical protein
VGYVVQLLLVALYMSTYDDAPLSDQHAVSAHLTTHLARNDSIISNHRRLAARQPTTTTQRALVVAARQAQYQSAVTARQAHDQSAPDIRPPAKNSSPDANDAAAR